MMSRFVKTLTCILTLLGASAAGAGQAGLDAFPPAATGMQRFVIQLPHKAREDEDTFRVELIVGREALTDGVNQMRLGNIIEPRILQGWGYTYYEVTGSSAVLGTLLHPPEGGTAVKAFVTAPSLLVRYNSRLPVVIYAPMDYQVRYRLWQAAAITETAEPD